MIKKYKEEKALTAKQAALQIIQDEIWGMDHRAIESVDDFELATEKEVAEIKRQVMKYLARIQKTI
tara:strand:- start:443 stop:640 length:198 start_codon:yes stop_codon:yes gene_type:complete